jgi:hypothetical protein
MRTRLALLALAAVVPHLTGCVAYTYRALPKTAEAIRAPAAGVVRLTLVDYTTIHLHRPREVARDSVFGLVRQADSEGLLRVGVPRHGRAASVARSRSSPLPIPDSGSRGVPAAHRQSLGARFRPEPGPHRAPNTPDSPGFRPRPAPQTDPLQH